VDICDVDDYLTCSGCETTGRTSGFECQVTEQGDGCCLVLLFCKTPGCFIEEGSGPIATIGYDVLEEAPAGACRGLNPEGAVVPDENGSSLGVESLPGQFCFTHVPESPASIPTLSEWGMIIFMMIMLGIGVVTILRRRMV
jgi:hypothetical protein